MEKKNNKNQKYYYAISIIIALLILTTPFLIITFNKPFYYSQYEKNNLYKIMDEQKTKELTDQILKGLQNQHKIQEIHDITKNEQEHLYDVSVLLEKTKIILIVLAVLLAFSIIILRKKLSQQDIGIILFTAGITSIIIIVLLGILYVSNFQFGFEIFHKIFFPMGNYSFPINSTLITLFPQEFFKAALFNIIGLSIIFSAILVVVGIMLEKKNQTK